MNLACLPRSILFVAALAFGCGGDSTAPKRPTGTLKGKLTLAGKPMPAGTGIVFQHPETGSLFMAITDEDGSFKVERPSATMPAGRYDVSIQPTGALDDPTAGAEPALEGKPGAKPAGAPVEMPMKYRNSQESGLGFELQAGANERAIDLKM
jgi:hypothetical protein